MAPPTLFCPHDQHRAVGVADDGVRDTAHEGPSDTAQPSAAHHYQPCTYLLGQGDDLFVRFPHPEMGLHYGASVSLDAEETERLLTSAVRPLSRSWAGPDQVVPSCPSPLSGCAWAPAPQDRK